MRARVVKWIVPCLLLLLAGAWLFWRQEIRLAEKSAPGRFSYTAPRPVLPGQLPAANEPVPPEFQNLMDAIARKIDDPDKA